MWMEQRVGRVDEVYWRNEYLFGDVEVMRRSVELGDRRGDGSWVRMQGFNPSSISPPLPET